ncbi:MAG: hypothetical protein AAGE94_07945 [Acidobacteriota bacterium]
MTPNDKNPLKSVWTWFSTISGIVSLASMVDNLVAWKGFIEALVLHYQRLVYPVFDLMLAWLPFQIPRALCDYLVLGCIVGGSYIRTLSSVEQLRGYGSRLIPLDFELAGLVSRVFGWPVVLGYYTVRLLSKGRFDEDAERRRWDRHFEKNPSKLKTHDDAVDGMIRHMFGKYMEPVKFFQWLGAILFGTFLLLIVNQAL